MSSLPTFHDRTTIGDSTATANPATTTTTSTSHTHQDVPAKANTGSDFTQNDHDTISAVPARDRLNSEYEPTTEITQPRGSLSSTTGPFQVPTTDDVSKKDAPLTSSVGTQSAPGRAGSIGEKALGALGYGGSKVERPKEDQGLGEKIVNFFGA